MGAILFAFNSCFYLQHSLDLNAWMLWAIKILASRLRERLEAASDALADTVEIGSFVTV